MLLMLTCVVETGETGEDDGKIEPFSSPKRLLRLTKGPFLMATTRNFALKYAETAL